MNLAPGLFIRSGFSWTCFPLADSKANPIDIFAIGFEEMVELNAGNIVSARYVGGGRAGVLMRSSFL